MLNKKRTSSVGKVKYLALAPLFMGMMFINNIDVMARVGDNQAPQPLPAIQETALVAPLPPEDDKVYDEVANPPMYPDGEGSLMSYLAKTINYPVEGQKNKEQGKVVVTFIIDKKGNPTDFEVTQSVSSLLDAEALRVTKTIKKWTPGKLADGTPVRVRMNVPIMFRLQ